MIRLCLALAGLVVVSSTFAQDKPVAADPRLVVELVAAAPDIVHPIAMDFDAKGRLLVVESHTHFRPAKYAGPKADRVRMFDVGTGKATTFFEGTTHTMDVAVHQDGSVYVATRNEILRLRDTKGAGVADEKTRIAFLDTAGNYPHNGLSGLSFDFHGDLTFGMGENLGAGYKLTGADGTALTGGGEGGNLYHCTADGKKLRRVATGFWNPFGSCRDIYGRLFVVDNDPDASPPCRLLHVVEGADFGFQFRYGRAGRHPFQAWNGELPGTLPYAAGTGESPCEVVAYESDGLPAEYRGHLLVPVWADHRVERYVPRQNGAGVAADRKPFVTGGREFRPSGLAVAPDGSVYVSDWVSQSYELHGKGAIWRVRWKDAKPQPRPADPKQAIVHPDRATREKAARKLASEPAGRTHLHELLASADSRVRAAALMALVLQTNEADPAYASIARSDSEPGLREMAVAGLIAAKADVTAFAAEGHPASVRAEAIAGLSHERQVPGLLKLLGDPDPYLRHEAVHRLAQLPTLLTRVDPSKVSDPKQRAGLLLAWRSANHLKAVRLIPEFLTDPDPDVRLLAAKWVSDEKLTAFRPQIVDALKNPTLDPRAFLALTTTLARLDDKPVNEDSLAAYFVERLADRAAPLPARVMALKAIPATNPRLKLDVLTELLKQPDDAARVEVLRALKDRADPKAVDVTHIFAANPNESPAVRAQALLVHATGAADTTLLVGLATGADVALRDDALRGLVGAKLTPAQIKRLEALGKSDAAARVLGKPFHAARPPATDIEAWLKRLDGPADPDAGRRVFEHPKLAGCYRCHRVDGRGADIGPDLSLIGRTDRRWIVESILQPSAVVAPHYLSWKVETTDGRARTGLLVGTHLDESVYVDAKGERFKVLAGDTVEATPVRTSIMPDGLLDALTDQEARDLIAFLLSRK